MFFCLIFFLILIFILCIVNHKSHWSKPLIFMIISYFLAICSMLVYLSKHTYYYNILTTYFVLPKMLWKKLFFLKINRFHLIRLLNWSSSSIVFFSVYFSFSIVKSVHAKLVHMITLLVLIYSVILNIIYDPNVSIWIYYKLYPDVFSAQEYASIQTAFHMITKGINCSVLIATLILFLYYCLQTIPVKLFRIHLFTIFANYFIMCVCYFTFLSFAPDWYLTISKKANRYYFQPIRLWTNTAWYQIFPYLLIFSTVMISISYWKYLTLIRGIENENLEISHQISASETTSKVFCHFIKNELLGIRSEIAMLPTTAENEQQIHLLLEHCQQLYRRIDSIHHSTKTSELHLKKCSIQNILHTTLDLFTGELKDILIIEKLPKEDIYAFVDEQYLGQALHNLIHNAITALNDKAQNISYTPVITFHLYQAGKWLIFSIEDNGIGISENNLPQIFTPFFSSKPFSEHWGIGLSLTHKIIAAHDGKIQVESTLGKGTCFKIFLPNIYHINL